MHGKCAPTSQWQYTIDEGRHRLSTRYMLDEFAGVQHKQVNLKTHLLNWSSYLQISHREVRTWCIPAEATRQHPSTQHPHSRGLQGGPWMQRRSASLRQWQRNGGIQMAPVGRCTP